VAVKLLIDSNRFTDFARGLAEVVARFESADELWISLIVLGELRGGFAFGTKRDINEEILEKFLGRSMVQVLALDEETVDHYAAVYGGLRRGGNPTPPTICGSRRKRFNTTLSSTPAICTFTT
jgi:predicted nucleic acid-binding protein